MNTTRSTHVHASLMLLTLGMAVLALAPAALSAEMKGAYEETIERQLPFNPGASLTLTERNGSVSIGVWKQDGIKIVAKKRMRVEHSGTWFARLIGLKVPKIESDEDAQACLKEFTMDISGDADGLEVKTSYPSSAGNLRFTMSYEILLPREAQVSLHTTNGSIEVTGVKGTVEAKSTNGHVTFRDISGPVHARTTNGRIDLDGITGEIEARTVNGRISGRLAALPATGADVKCRTINGRISLGVPRDANFDLDIQTRSSRVSSDFELTSVTTQKPKQLEGTIGGGGPLISLRTINGSIEIEAI